MSTELIAAVTLKVDGEYQPPGSRVTIEDDDEAIHLVEVGDATFPPAEPKVAKRGIRKASRKKEPDPPTTGQRKGGGEGGDGETDPALVLTETNLDELEAALAGVDDVETVQAAAKLDERKGAAEMYATRIAELAPKEAGDGDGESDDSTDSEGDGGDAES